MMDQINQTILKISQNPTNCIIIYTANESINTKDLKPLQALIKENNLTMMINYNIVNYDKITITILKKQLYGISPL
jgi:hypothetical protein